MEFFKKYRNTILKYAFLLFLMFFTVYLVFKNLDINSIDKIKNIIDKKYRGLCYITIYHFRRDNFKANSRCTI